ncbi:MAG TPA: alpha/beta hydrolase [Acidimicrobiales bacterium]
MPSTIWASQPMSIPRASKPRRSTVAHASCRARADPSIRPGRRVRIACAAMERDPACGPNDSVIELADGRQLAYATFGDPSGHPVINCHGGLVSRNDCALADEHARELGLWIISPDRPGVGSSDRLPGHDIVSWADRDLRQLVDVLSLDRFSVMGWSAGGQRALAAAHVLGDRIDRVAVVAGCLPLDDPASRALLSRSDRRLLRWTDSARSTAKAYFRVTNLLANRAPERLARLSARDLEGTERGVLAQHSAWFAHVIAQGTRDPNGQVDDYRAFGAPWRFQPEDIRVPVVVHHGTDDRMVPLIWGEALSQLIPDASLRTYPGEGHLVAVTQARNILASLRAT